MFSHPVSRNASKENLNTFRDSAVDPLGSQRTIGEGTATKKSHLYLDVALVRYRNSEQVRVLKDNEFIKEFQTRPNDDYWRRVEVVQTCLKSRCGVGTPIFVEFVAPIDPEAPE